MYAFVSMCECEVIYYVLHLFPDHSGICIGICNISFINNLNICFDLFLNSFAEGIRRPRSHEANYGSSFI